MGRGIRVWDLCCKLMKILATSGLLGLSECNASGYQTVPSSRHPQTVLSDGKGMTPSHPLPHSPSYSIFPNPNPNPENWDQCKNTYQFITQCKGDTYTGWPKKLHHILYALPSSNINRFSKLLHYQN